MSPLTVTAKGQVTLRRDLLCHLGLQPGQQIEVPAAAPPGHIDDFMGLLAGRTCKLASLPELRQAAEQGWAGQR
jgi:hypothetical protein